MKRIVLSILIITLSSGSLYAQNHDSIIQFNFDTSTRGYSKGIVLRKDSVFIHVISKLRNTHNLDYKGIITKSEWDSLINSIEDLSLSEMRTLKSPTNRRAGDGALFSSIMITNSFGKYLSQEFDDYNPNEKLKELMRVIQEIEKVRH